MRLRMDELFEILGAVYGWCFSKYDGGSICLKYWPAADKKFSPWPLSRRPIIILAGYMSRNRGRHWDRKRRWVMKYYIWKSIIDDMTCERCLELDGKVLSEEQIRTLHPPLHDKTKSLIDCRCVLEEIRVNIPKANGNLGRASKRCIFMLRRTVEKLGWTFEKK